MPEEVKWAWHFSVAARIQAALYDSFCVSNLKYPDWGDVNGFWPYSQWLKQKCDPGRRSIIRPFPRHNVSISQRVWKGPSGSGSDSHSREKVLRLSCSDKAEFNTSLQSIYFKMSASRSFVVCSLNQLRHIKQREAKRVLTVSPVIILFTESIASQACWQVSKIVNKISSLLAH